MSIDQREIVATTPKHWIRLTRTCNNNCIFCLDKEAQGGSSIPMAEVKKDLIRGRKKKIKNVILSGGEPTLHPRFLEIVKLSRNLGYGHIQVITNGRMFAYSDFLNLAVKTGVNEITFSIHGYNEKLHDKQTQVKGSFNQSLAGLKNALKIDGVIVNIDIVINKTNVKFLADILKFFIKLGVSEFDLLQVIPFGRAWDNREEVIYEIDKSLVYLRQAFQLSKNQNLYLWTNRFPVKYLEGFEELIQHPFKLYDEIRGRKEMFERFINGGKPLGCMGERCRYCFLENFCKDLIKFKKKKKSIAKNQPYCLQSSKKPAYVNINNYKKLILNNDKVNIFKFLDFYINKRYFVKSLRCKECKFDTACQGAHINYIRRNGFKSINPIK